MTHKKRKVCKNIGEIHQQFLSASLISDYWRSAFRNSAKEEKEEKIDYLSLLSLVRIVVFVGV